MPPKIRSTTVGGSGAITGRGGVVMGAAAEGAPPSTSDAVMGAVVGAFASAAGASVPVAGLPLLALSRACNRLTSSVRIPSST